MGAALACLLCAVSTSTGLHYRYAGLTYGVRSERVALTRADVLAAGGHAAVWAGVSSPRNAVWLQAGIERESGDSHPWFYIERGRDGNQVSLRVWPASFGQSVFVRLARGPTGWRVSIGGHRSTAVRVPRARSIATLETLGPAVAVARIGPRLVQID
jgi:hypothetical protein